MKTSKPGTNESANDEQSRDSKGESDVTGGSGAGSTGVGGDMIVRGAGGSGGDISGVDQVAEKHSRGLSEKGFQFKKECLIRNVKSFMSKYRSVAAQAEGTIADSENLADLRLARSLLEDSINKVSDSFHALTPLLENDEYDNLNKAVDDIERKNLDLLKRLTERTREVQQECGSQRSIASRSSRASSRSSQRSCSSAERKAEAAAEAAALQAKLHYIDVEAKQRAELEKIQTKIQLDMANAKMKAYDEALSDDPGEYFDLVDENISTRRRNEAPILLNADAPAFFPQSSGLPEAHTKPNFIEDLGASMNKLAESMVEQANISRYPILEPAPFSGDPIHYSAWKSSVDILIDRKGIPEDEKIFYLKRYLTGAAQEAVDGFFLLPTAESYHLAKQLLEERFGDPFFVTNAFRDKLEKWPKVSNRDSIGLRKFSDFWGQCLIAAKTNARLRILDDDRENRKLVSKLPEHLANRWARLVSSWREEKHSFPTFETFVEFLRKEARIANEPVLSSTTGKYETRKPASTQMDQRPKVNNARGFKTSAQQVSTRKPPETKCKMCGLGDHMIVACETFLALTPVERKQTVMSKGLCFGCLKSGNHKSSECRSRMTCETCGKRHPTCLHGTHNLKRPGQETQDGTARQQDTNQSSQDTAQHSSEPVVARVKLFFSFYLNDISPGSSHPSIQCDARSLTGDLPTTAPLTTDL